MAELSDRSAYHVHLGTATVPARIRFLDGDEFAVVSLTKRLPMQIGDRFILRDTGRRRVAAGGIVLDPVPVRRPTRGEAEQLDVALPEGSDAQATAMVGVHGSIDGSVLSAATGDGTPAHAVPAGDRFISTGAAAEQIDEAVALVQAFHQAHPLRPGMPVSSLASKLGLDKRQLAAIVAEADGALIDEGATIRSAGFEQLLGSEHDEAWSSARSLLAVSLAVPRAGQLGLSEELLHAIVRRGDLVQIDGDLVYLPEQVEEIIASLDDLEEPFTVSVFRDSLGLSRRQAVPLLEWLDRSGRTIRTGDVRTVRR